MWFTLSSSDICSSTLRQKARTSWLYITSFSRRLGVGPKFLFHGSLTANRLAKQLVELSLALLSACEFFLSVLKPDPSCAFQVENCLPAYRSGLPVMCADVLVPLEPSIDIKIVSLGNIPGSWGWDKMTGSVIVVVASVSMISVPALALSVDMLLVTRLSPLQSSVMHKQYPASP